MIESKTLLRRRDPYDFRWPSGNEETFPQAPEYMVVKSGSRRARAIVGYGRRHAFGRDRRRIIVFLKLTGGKWWPAVQFVGTDDYDATGQVIWAIKQVGSNKHATADREISPDFDVGSVVAFARYIRGKGTFRNSFGFLANEEDEDQILEVALIRASHRGATLSSK